MLQVEPRLLAQLSKETGGGSCEVVG
ncbi:uncharacterized protein METZ01_LOCUS374140, partial [marine metagenome]